MRILKLALLSGAVFATTVLGSHAPASATSLIASLSKGMNGAAGQSAVILVQNKRKRGGKSNRGNRSNSGRNAAAAAVGAAAVIGIIGAIANDAAQRRIEECAARHEDVDTERGVWYDKRNNEHPC
jgi:hypothetical protein